MLFITFLTWKYLKVVFFPGKYNLVSSTRLAHKAGAGRDWHQFISCCQGREVWAMIINLPVFVECIHSKSYVAAWSPLSLSVTLTYFTLITPSWTGLSPAAGAAVTPRGGRQQRRGSSGLAAGPCWAGWRSPVLGWWHTYPGSRGGPGQTEYQEEPRPPPRPLLDLPGSVRAYRTQDKCTGQLEKDLK